jgi:GNAT superfamily N-acetyltransferase
METVLHMRRELVTRADPELLQGIVVRNYRGDKDIERWLDLRHRAFARERVGVRQWQAADFEQEFLERDWWQPERMWLAEDASLDSAAGAPLVGAVTLALRAGAETTVPVVHWLVVRPGWRRRGIAGLLMDHLEAYCWDAGWREVRLETHAAWEAAAEFYRGRGYEPILNEPESR